MAPLDYLFCSAYLTGGVLAALAVGIMPRRSERITFACGLLVFVAETAGDALAISATSAGDALAWKTRALLAAALGPALWLQFSSGYARAEAAEPRRRWKAALLLVVLGAGLIAILARDHLISAVVLDQSDGSWKIELGPAGIGLHVAMLAGFIPAIANLERTYRASVGLARWRIKYVLLGVAVMLTVRTYTTTQTLLFQAIDTNWCTFNAAGLLFGGLLATRSLPRAFRIRTEIYPSPTVIRNSLTFVIAGAYLACLGVAAKLLGAVGGRATFQLRAVLVLIGVVGLVLLLQSDRARLALRQFVSRHFRRPMHDWRRVWTTVVESTALCLDQQELCRTSVRLVASTFDCLSVTIWLVDARNESVAFGASTFVPDAQGPHLAPRHRSDVARLIEFVRTQPGPSVLANCPGPIASLLRSPNRQEFPGGVFQLCVPLQSRGEILGLLLIGDHVGRSAFTTEDLDVLKCVADHTAGCLRNAQLSRQLVQTRESEAFQRMAAFFVHDLKNAASTLSLMLQNLPTHYDDARFRDDALRGIGKTVAHVNHLIGRLGELRRTLSLEPAELDFNAMVTQALAGFTLPPHVGMVTELGSVPPVQCDADQMAKVVTNLVLNATEAVAEEGRIRVATSARNGWAVLSVADNGCGMAPEFVNRSLFQPFQTTKKNGLGVGMFQTKMIVEAHGGRVAVESRPGRGTTFQVFIPTQLCSP